MVAMNRSKVSCSPSLKGEEGRLGPITEAFLLMAQRSAAMLIHCRIPCA